MYTTLDGAKQSIETVKKTVENGVTQIICDKHGLYKFTLLANNYRVLAVGANYASEKRAISAMESFKKFAINSEVVSIEQLPADEKDASLEEAKIETTSKKHGGKFEVIIEEDKEYTWQLKASNGEILATSSDYTTKSGCLNGIDAFKETAKTGKFYISKDKNNKFQYKLYSKHGRLLVVGEVYSSKALCNSAVNSVISFVEDAVIVE